MCRSKMATDIIQPNNNNNNNDNKNKNNIKTPSKSSSTSPTTTATRTDPTSTSSSTHTSSSRRSLASFRSSLGDSPHLYDISEIRTATNNFLSKKGTSPSHNNSSSWRCTLHGKDVIIFQRRSQNQQNLIPNNIRRKLSSLCRSHHVAIVNLIGASISGDYIYLVYDFVRGASLYDLLHNKNNPGFTILNTWMSRVQVASDLASGLDYIHNNCTSLDVTFVHNHVKSSSVIVTEPSFGARLCHFGVSELCGESTEDVRGNFGRNGAIDEIVEEDAGVGTTSFRTLNRSNSVKFNGTMGYMSPEFQATGVGTRKSDVYAFGVVLIELLSGEEPVKYKLDKATREYRKISAIDNAISVIDNDAGGGERDGRIRQWIDRRLRDSYPIDVAEKLTRLAVECVHTDPDKRPDMRRVAGKISKLYLESHVWCDKMSVPTDFTVSFAAR